MKKFIRKIAALATFVLLCFAALPQDNRSQLTGQIISTLDSSYVHYSKNSKKQEQTGRVFDSLFKLLVQDQRLRPSVITNEDNLQNKILAMAKYQAQNSSRFTEIESRYIFNIDNATLQAPTAPPVLPVHATENYRLAWEYFLLRPPSVMFSPRYDIRAAEAINSINNPASVITLESVYKFSAARKVVLDHPIVSKQRLTLSTISKMPSEKALRSIVSILAYPRQAEDSSLKVKWAPLEFARELYKPKGNPEIENKWKAVIRRVDLSGFDANSKKILRNLDLLK